jgi:hypothetical protein
MAFHRNNGNNNRYNNNRQNYRPRHNNNQQQGGQRRHVNRINQVFESTGPDGRVRGTAQQLVEKYASLARDAHASGDTVLMLNCYQHAEHYQRLYNEIVEENAVHEREREAQRAQYQQQPTIEDDQAAPSEEQADSSHYQNQAAENNISAPQQTEQAPEAAVAPRPTPAPRQSAPQAPRGQTAASSTGGRVLGRRPGPHARDNQGTSQMRDEDMPSFLKKDIPIKAAAPVAAPAEADHAEAAPTAFGRARRTPTPRRAAPPASTADQATPKIQASASDEGDAS